MVEMQAEMHTSKVYSILSNFNHDWNWPQYVYSLKNLFKNRHWY